MAAGALLLAGCMAPPSPPPYGGRPTGPIGAGTNGGGTGPARPAPAAPVSGPAAVQQMAQLVNAHRQSHGCPALEWLPAAAEAAQAHSTDMARRDYFDHVSPEGQRPWDRLVARGVSYRRMAENIAWTPRGGAQLTLRGWIDSPGHRQNLENCTFTHHGIGLQDDYWTHVFVTPVAPPRT
jgi:uncharacterized protein YkwD